MPALEASKMASVDCLNKEYLGKLRNGYLKILGETEPRLSTLPVLTAEKNLSTFFVHEYIWELGFTGYIDPKTERPRDWSNRLIKKDDAIIVQAIFYTNNSNYLARTLTATLKPPIMIKKSVLDSICDGWMKMTGTSTKFIGEATNIPGFREMGLRMEQVKEMEKGSVPLSHAYPWHSRMITIPDGDGKPLNAVEWRIKRKAFRNLGNRLIGGMGLIFIKSSYSKEKKDHINIEMRARISFKKTRFSRRNNYDIWLPSNPNINGKKEKLLIKINPKPIE